MTIIYSRTCVLDDKLLLEPLILSWYMFRLQGLWGLMPYWRVWIMVLILYSYIPISFHVQLGSVSNNLTPARLRHSCGTFRHTSHLDVLTGVAKLITSPFLRPVFVAILSANCRLCECSADFTAGPGRSWTKACFSHTVTIINELHKRRDFELKTNQTSGSIGE